MNQLESRLKEEKAAHLRGQERELDQFRHSCDRDMERLRTRIKMDLENRVSMWERVRRCGSGPLCVQSGVLLSMR